MPRQPTIRDIAAACQLHYSTVSLALRKDPRIPLSTVERVRQAATTLGYRPDPSITSLMTRIRSGKPNTYRETLAWVTCPTLVDDWRKNHAMKGFYSGAQEKAKALGYKINLIEDKELIRTRLNEVLLSRGIRGVVFSTLFEVNGIGHLDWERIIAVQIEPHDFLPSLPTLSNDQSQAVRKAFHQARLLGYRRIGMAINNVWDTRVGNAWFSGYLMDSYTLAEHERIPPFGISEWNEEAFAKWLHQYKPDVILTIDRRYVWQWLNRMQLRVPNDVAYIDLDLPDIDPAFAGIQQNHDVVGATAISLLASRLYHNETGSVGSRMTTRIEGNWHHGASAPGISKQPRKSLSPRTRQRGRKPQA